MVSWEYLWPTLRCRQEEGVSPLLSIGWWYLSSVSPKRHCCRVSAADKGCRVYPLDPRPDAVALYSGCTSGKAVPGICQMTGTLPPLLDSVLGGGTPGRRCLRVHMDPMLLCPGKGLVLPTNPTIEEIAKNTRFFILSLPNNEMSGKSPFAIFKALQAIVAPHKSLNSSRGAISEPDLLYTSKTEILEGFSDQGVVQVTKPSTATTTTQTDENITKIVCPPLKLLQPLISDPKPTISSSVPALNKSSASTQAELVPSTSSVTVASPSKSQPPNSVIDTASTTSNRLSISAASSSSTACSVHEMTTTTSNTIPATSQDTNQTSKPCRKKLPPKNQSNTIKSKIEIKMAPHRPRKSGPNEYTTDEEDMIIYDVWKKNLNEWFHLQGRGPQWSLSRAYAWHVMDLNPGVIEDLLRRKADASYICRGSKSSRWRDVVVWRGDASSGVVRII
ncbi:uncharacterized protein TNCV_4619191 [Trichonephila clavipes]|nr:uncharacterized protein TNCV_4619191 [Trichonephila clavipes]